MEYLRGLPLLYVCYTLEYCAFTLLLSVFPQRFSLSMGGLSTKSKYVCMEGQTSYRARSRLSRRRSKRRLAQFGVFFEMYRRWAIWRFPFFTIEDLGLDAKQVGQAFSAFTFAQLAGALTFGRVSDNFGRVPVADSAGSLAFCERTFFFPAKVFRLGAVSASKPRAPVAGVGALPACTESRGRGGGFLCRVLRVRRCC